MRTLVRQGKSIIFITHKLREVLASADRISVMRAGKMIGSVKPAEATQHTLAEMMVGRNVILQIDKSDAHPGADVLNIRGLRVFDDRHHLAVDDVSLDVRAGEILGIAGVQGNGQTELTEALTGLRPLSGGQISIDGHDIPHITPRGMIESQISHVPEDRHKHGLVLSFSVRDNMALCSYYQAPYAKGIEMNFPVIKERATQLTRQYDVRTPSIDTNVGSLSGGNQQKVIIARELTRPVKLLIASQPTRGLDVGSIEFIHRQIVDARDRGAAVLLISAELDEILALSDRIAVMYKGRILETVDAKDASREKLGLLMAGVKDGVHV
jgi:simple sugar transport system ATP-binding protein